MWYLWSDEIRLLCCDSPECLVLSSGSLLIFCLVVHFVAFILLKCPIWAWYCCTLADNFCSWFDLSEPCKPARLSYGCIINVMLACFNWSKTHHLRSSFSHNTSPLTWKTFTGSRFGFKISRTLWSSSASLCSTPPSYLSELSAALPLGSGPSRLAHRM